MTTLLALDIETSGLDPVYASIQAIGLSTEAGHEAFVGDETDILHDLEARIASAPSIVVLVTWNGEEFDLPFLRARADLLGVPLTLELEPTSGVGKYGSPLFKGTWGGRAHVDIAPLFKECAEAHDLPWSLKPVAREVLGVEPIEVDRRGESIAAMATEDLVAYVCSDTDITLRLAKMLGRLPDNAGRQARVSRTT